MTRLLLVAVALLWLSSTAAAQLDTIDAARTAIQAEDWSEAASLLTHQIAVDSSDLNARYLRGIAYAEKGKYRTLQTRIGNTLDAAAEDFGFIVEHDSLYRDVLYQFGRLRWYAGDLRSAIALGEAQLRLKPDLAHARLGLHQFYWQYILRTDPVQAREWLRAQASDIAQLFLGYTYQQQSLYQAAERVYHGLVGQLRVRVPALIALARLHFDTGQPALGAETMDRANEGIASDADALLMFDVIKTIVTPREQYEFEAIRTVNDYQQFFSVFWTERNPDAGIFLQPAYGGAFPKAAIGRAAPPVSGIPRLVSQSVYRRCRAFSFHLPIGTGLRRSRDRLYAPRRTGRLYHR